MISPSTISGSAEIRYRRLVWIKIDTNPESVPWSAPNASTTHSLETHPSKQLPPTTALWARSFQNERLPLLRRSLPSPQHSHPHLQHARTKILRRNKF